MAARTIQLTAMATPQPGIIETDEELVDRTLSGDREAFGELAVRYEASLFGHLRRLTQSREDAEELAQEALLKAYRALPTFRRHSAFNAWLFCIATNLARDALRRKGRVLFEDTENMPELADYHVPSPPDVLEQKRNACRLEVAVQQLSPFLQSILNLYYREEMPMSQIARVYQRDRRSIAVAIHRARERLRQMLQNPGGNP